MSKLLKLANLCDYLTSAEKGNEIAMFKLACYYLKTKNYELMKRYLRMAIDKGNKKAMYVLGLYFQVKEKDYEQMKIYYLLAIEKGHEKAMYLLGSYFKIIEKDYEQMKKYFLMAIEKGHIKAMRDLASHYLYIENNLELYKKYMSMAGYELQIEIHIRDKSDNENTDFKRRKII